jgi:hypothetical protein
MEKTASLDKNNKVLNIRPNGRADGHKVHPYSNTPLSAFLGIICGKKQIIILSLLLYS